MSNPFQTSTTAFGEDQIASDQAGHGPSSLEVHTQERENQTAEKAMEMATELRAAGHPRHAVVAQLGNLNVSPTAAEYLINQADMFAGMMGRPHPADIDENVRAQIDAAGPMMISDSLADQMNTSAVPGGSKEKTMAKAKAMAADGAEYAAIEVFLTTNGAPMDEAREIAKELVDEHTPKGDGDSPKKRRGLFRRR